MDLIDIVRRGPGPSSVTEGAKIPWHDPEFSRRMLREHLSQEHDAASRRFERIDRHVRWVHETLLAGRSGRVLDLGCGPGLYAERLARLGHRCVGIDFSPASIEYARQRAEKEALACEYALADLLTAEYGAGFDLAMFLFGELNTFPRIDAANIVKKAHQSIAPGGTFLLEAHTFAAVRAMGESDAAWYSSERGLFSDSGHICLMEETWDDDSRAATQRFFIIDAGDGRVTHHSQTVRAYTDDEYIDLLEAAGFTNVVFHASMGEDGEAPGPGMSTASGGQAEPGTDAKGRSGDFVVLTAEKPGGTRA